jgi:hypothetical protein
MNHGENGPPGVKSFELLAADDLTEPIEIWPCNSCGSWHAEVYRRADGRGAVREWHDERCPHLLAVIRDFEADSVD